MVLFERGVVGWFDVVEKVVRDDKVLGNAGFLAEAIDGFSQRRRDVGSGDKAGDKLLARQIAAQPGEVRCFVQSGVEQNLQENPAVELSVVRLKRWIAEHGAAQHLV